MNTTNAAVGTGALVVIGRWAEGNGLEVKVVVGVVGLAVLLALLPDAIAGPFAALIVVASLFRYLPAIVGATKLGE